MYAKRSWRLLAGAILAIKFSPRQGSREIGPCIESGAD